jgi:transcriptional regulator with XRE-family HTH domain
VNVFKDRLKELRQEMGLTQLQIAEVLKIPATTYANWEQGRREPGIDGIIMLCHFFKVTADCLIGIEH